jgi:hypothetical protein
MVKADSQLHGVDNTRVGTAGMIIFTFIRGELPNEVVLIYNAYSNNLACWLVKNEQTGNDILDKGFDQKKKTTDRTGCVQNVFLNQK